MTSEPLPRAAQPEYLTDALRRCGALADGRVCRVAVESSRATLLSRIIRLRLSYEGAAAETPRSIILKTGLPERANAKWNSGRQEVAFYTRIAAAMAEPSVPRCFEAVWDPDTKTWHLLLEDLTDSHFTLGDWPMPPTLAQSEQIIAARARFHAAWWDDPRLGVSIGTWLDPADRQLDRIRGRGRALCRSGRRPVVTRAPRFLPTVGRCGTPPEQALPFASRHDDRSGRCPCLEHLPASGGRQR
jgi:hypothetical protein